MTPVSDSDLSSVTGQAGVNINADITMDIGLGTLAWGDADGINKGPLNPWTTSQAGGYVGVTGFNIANLRIRARTETGDDYNGYTTLFLKPITIDVATGDANNDKDWMDGITFVRFGLGALQISLGAMSFDVALGERVSDSAAGTAAAAVALDQEMGSVNLGDMEIYINPWSYVDIYATNGATAGAQGVSFDLNVQIDKFVMGYASWGDSDGLAGGNASDNALVTWMNGGTDDMNGGYVGMRDFEILTFENDGAHPAIAISGTVAIDVATSLHGTYADLEYFMTEMTDPIQAMDGDMGDEASIVKILGSMDDYLGVPSANADLTTIISDLRGILTNTTQQTILQNVLAGLVVEEAIEAYPTTLGAYAAAQTEYYVGLETMTEEQINAAVVADVIAYAALGGIDLNAVITAKYTDVMTALGGLPTDGVDGAASRSVVHISFPNTWFQNTNGNNIGLQVKVATIVANVALSSDKTLAVDPANDQILGDIYIEGIDLQIHQGSWVDIWAH